MVELDRKFKSRTATSDSLKISSPKVRDDPFGCSSPLITSVCPDQSNFRGSIPESPVLSSSHCDTLASMVIARKVGCYTDKASWYAWNSFIPEDFSSVLVDLMTGLVMNLYSSSSGLIELIVPPEVTFLYGSLPRPPENCFISCSLHKFTDLVCDWFMHSISQNLDYGALRCHMDSDDSFRHQHLCRQGEKLKFAVDPCCLVLCDFQADCYSFLLLESLAYGVYVLMLMNFRGLQLLASLAHGSFINFCATEDAALVQHLHILLHLISLDKQQGVAAFVFWPRYNGFGSPFFLICEAGLLNIAAVKLLVASLSLQFFQRIICYPREEDPRQEVYIRNEFNMLKLFCDHVLHLVSFAQVLLMHRTVFKLFVDQVLLMAIVSTSSPQFLIFSCCNLLPQKMLKFEKMAYLTYGLLLRHILLHIHVGCFLPYWFLMWNQAFCCLCHICDCEALLCSLDGSDFLLRHRWWVSKKTLIIVDDQVLCKRLSRDYVSRGEIIVAHSGWFRSILDLLYCSLPRPPEVLCDFL